MSLKGCNTGDFIKGLMCPVLHMARCTNVAHLGASCPSLRSRFGFVKATLKNYSR